MACHQTGAAGALKIGDPAWRDRVEEKGMLVLLANVKKGYKAMPPRGFCPSCTDGEFVALIEYMVSPEKKAP